MARADFPMNVSERVRTETQFAGELTACLTYARLEEHINEKRRALIPPFVFGLENKYA
jgi:hypothetical protein